MKRRGNESFDLGLGLVFFFFFFCVVCFGEKMGGKRGVERWISDVLF